MDRRPGSAGRPDTETSGLAVATDGAPRVVFTVSSSYSDFPRAHGVWIGTVAGDQVFSDGAPASFYPPRVSALPNGRSLLVGDGVLEPTVAVAPVLDAP